MNKIHQLTIIKQPTKNQVPDHQNKNRIASTSIEINSIKRYLESIKTHHNVHTKLKLSQQKEQRKQLQKSGNLQNQQHLRRRIMQLEKENNQFQLLSRQYETLAQRNKQLQAQMLLLLNELQQCQREGISPLRNVSHNSSIKLGDHSTIENYRTQESVESVQLKTEKQIYHPRSFGDQKSGSSHYEIEPFRDVEVDHVNQSFLIQENIHLKEENSRIKQMIESEIKTAIASLQLKFMSYIVSMENKIAQMKTTNEQILKLKFKDSARSQSKSSNSQVKQPIKVKLSSSNKNLKSSNHNLQEYSNQNLKQRQNLYGNKKQQDLSLVNIQIDNLSESQHSFGKSAHRHVFDSHVINPPQNTPDVFHRKSFEPAIVQSQRYEQTIMKQVLQNLDRLRQNLTFLLGEHQQTNRNQMKEFENNVYQQLKYIISIFFPIKNSKISFSLENELFNESNLMKSKHKQYHSNESQWQQGRSKIVSQVRKDISKMASEKYLNNSYYQSLFPSICSQQFQEIHQKLTNVIAVMKSFNQEYGQILHKSRTFSLQYELISTPRNQI